MRMKDSLDCLRPSAGFPEAAIGPGLRPSPDPRAVKWDLQIMRYHLGLTPSEPARAARFVARLLWNTAGSLMSAWRFSTLHLR
jgi:hypothetical protein